MELLMVEFWFELEKQQQPYAIPTLIELLRVYYAEIVVTVKDLLLMINQSI